MISLLHLLSSLFRHLLIAHFRAAVQRQGDKYKLVPAVVQLMHRCCSAELLEAITSSPKMPSWWQKLFFQHVQIGMVHLRDLLVDSSHQYCLSEPEFSVSGDETTLQADSAVKHQNSNNIENEAKMLNEGKCKKNGAMDNIQNVESGRDSMGKGPYMCVVKISSKAEGLTIECASEHSYRKRADAIQSALESAASQVFCPYHAIDPT